MINEELNEVITKKDGSQARENIFSSNSVESLEKEETIANHTGLDGIDDEAVFSPAKIAEICGILQEPLRKRLERKRKKDHTCFIEISERGSQEAQYLYKVGKIREITEEMMKE
ncbi:MAG: hypothetical protein GY869_05495 [Planctomycetes bacterium]|nr:hypothetical protein [Planctomycetota bacterium]